MKFLVIDLGQGFEFAHRLAQDGNKVYYYVDWQGSDFNLKNYAPGYGFKGIEKVNDFGSKIDDVDVILFNDIGYGGTISRLRKSGYPVVGAGRAEALEMDRVYAKQVLKESELEYPKTLIFGSINEALKYFKENNSEHLIKINTFRGDMETVFARDYDVAEVWLNALSNKIGPFNRDYKIIIEEPVDGVMVGIDTFFDGANFVRPYHFGLEIDADVVGRWEDNGIFDDMIRKLTPWLSQTEYIGPISIEAMYDGKSLKIIDFTCRFPLPLGAAIYTEFIKNFPALITGLARRQKVRPEVDDEYVGLMNMFSAPAKDMWIPIWFEEGIKIRLRRPVIVDGKYYHVPGENLVLSLLGSGSDVKSALDEVVSQVDKVKIYEGTMQDVFFDKIQDTLEELENYGLKF